MIRYIRINLLLYKRYLKNIIFIALLFCIPLFSCILSKSSSEKNTSNKALIYVEKENSAVNSTDSPDKPSSSSDKSSDSSDKPSDSPSCNQRQSLSDSLITSLSENYNGVSFEPCDSLEEMKEKIYSGEYDCGFVIKKSLEDHIKNGELNNDIDIYTTKSSLITPIIREYFFAELFKIYAPYKVTDYISRQDYTENMEDKHPGFIEYSETTIFKKFNYYMDSDELFSFKYISGNNRKKIDESLSISYIKMSIPGLVAISPVIFSFIGAFSLYADKDKKIFLAFSKKTRGIYKLTYILIPTFLAGISGFISLYLFGSYNTDDNHNKLTLIKLAAVMLIYVLICSLYTFLLTIIIKNIHVFSCVIPVVILGSIIFCPVFINTGDILPFGKYISYLFPPEYFLYFTSFIFR